MTSQLNVASIQHRIVWEDPLATFDIVRPLIAEAAESGSQLVCLSEMFSTGFSMAAERIAEHPEGPSVQFLSEQANKYDIWTCGSVPINDPAFERPVNQLVVCDSGGVVGRYNKIHPFSFAGEHEHYDAGSTFLTLELGGVRTTFFVCYDLRFANEFWNTAADTDLYVVVANWPEARSHHWKSLLMARAIENQAYVIATNRTGTDGNGFTYSGDSCIIDPVGEMLASVAHAEAVITSQVCADHVSKTRESFPFHQDRRP